jgi:hypothetical protein
MKGALLNCGSNPKYVFLRRLICVGKRSGRTESLPKVAGLIKYDYLIENGASSIYDASQCKSVELRSWKYSQTVVRQEMLWMIRPWAIMSPALFVTRYFGTDRARQIGMTYKYILEKQR